MAESFVGSYLDHFWSTASPPDLAEALERARVRLETLKEAGGKMMFAGNGASASMASHFALDFTKQAGIRAISFNDAPLLTAYANDYGYEHWVARAVEHHGRERDVAVLISSSGRSPNMVNAAETCRDRGVDVVTFTGFAPDNPLKSLGDINFWAESEAYNVVESTHTLWLGLLCDLIIGKREYEVKE